MKYGKNIVIIRKTERHKDTKAMFSNIACQNNIRNPAL
jgi:hypothetical protein